MAFPSLSLTFPESVNDCAFNSIAIESRNNVMTYFEPFIVSNKRKENRFIVYKVTLHSLHSQEAMEFTHLMLILNHR